VNDLKAQLAEQEIELTKKNEEADKLIEIVGIETEKVSKEKAIADEEELKVSFKTVIFGSVSSEVDRAFDYLPFLPPFCRNHLQLKVYF
jgi:DNA phosphorothioation-dependent restriction protein DptG